MAHHQPPPNSRRTQQQMKKEAAVAGEWRPNKRPSLDIIATVSVSVVWRKTQEDATLGRAAAHCGAFWSFSPFPWREWSTLEFVREDSVQTSHLHDRTSSPRCWCFCQRGCPATLWRDKVIRQMVSVWWEVSEENADEWNSASIASRKGDALKMRWRITEETRLLEYCIPIILLSNWPSCELYGICIQTQKTSSPVLLWLYL